MQSSTGSVCAGNRIAHPREEQLQNRIAISDDKIDPGYIALQRPADD